MAEARAAPVNAFVGAVTAAVVEGTGAGAGASLTGVTVVAAAA